MNINETLYCEISLAYCVLYYYPILPFFWLQIHLKSERKKEFRHENISKCSMVPKFIQKKNKRMIIKLIWDKIASFDDIIKISQFFLKTSVNLKWKHKLLFHNLRLVHVFWAQWHIWRIRHEEQ